MQAFVFMFSVVLSTHLKEEKKSNITSVFCYHSHANMMNQQHKGGDAKVNPKHKQLLYQPFFSHSTSTL